MAELLNIVGALRVKNEARWIRRSIESILPICDRVVVFDDHSADDTREIAASLGAEVIQSQFDGLDETRDKNYLLDWIGPADWIVMIDGDEALMPGHAELLASDLRTGRRFSGTITRALAMSVLYLWDREDQIRVDGVYRSMSRVSAFRPGKERFEATGGVNFHCGNCPQAIEGRAHAGVSLLHFGYMDAADRVRKYHWYRAQDPGNVMEDEYRHIVIGDLYGPQCRFKHGGPLELKSI